MSRELTIKTKFAVSKGNGDISLDSTIITGLSGSRMSNQQTVTSGSWQQVLTGSCRNAKWFAIENSTASRSDSKLMLNRNNTGEPNAVLEIGECAMYPVTSSVLYMQATTGSISAWILMTEK